MWLRFFTSEHREGVCYINSFEVHGLVDVGVCPGLQPFILGAEEGEASIHRHGPAVALKGEGGSTTGLRFDPSFSCGGRDGRGSRTMIFASPPSLTVISVPVFEKTCARGRRRDLRRRRDAGGALQ